MIENAEKYKRNRKTRNKRKNTRRKEKIECIIERIVVPPPERPNRPR